MEETQLALLEQLIADGEERAFPAAVARDVALPAVPRKAAALIGMRRVGKTYLALQELARHVAAGAPRTSALYLNFEDERPAGLELVQACAALGTPATRERELSALDAAMSELGVEQATIVTLTTEERIVLKRGTVHAVPFWVWSLGLT